MWKLSLLSFIIIALLWCIYKIVPVKSLEVGSDGGVGSSWAHLPPTNTPKFQLWHKSKKKKKTLSENSSSTTKDIKKKIYQDRLKGKRTDPVMTHTPGRGRGYHKLGDHLYGVKNLSSTLFTSAQRSCTRKTKPHNWFWKPVGLITERTRGL